MTRFLLIALGAALGANLRYLLGEWVAGLDPSRVDVSFPYATLLVNLGGSFALGILISLAMSRLAVPTNLRLLLAVGFLGSFTTFSSFAVDTLLLLEDDKIWYALGNIVLNNGLGLLLALLGYRLGQIV